MKQTKIIKLMRAFAPSDCAPLRQFVKSPYFNTNANLIELLDFILLFAPDFKSESLQVSAAFAYLFPDKFSTPAEELAVMTKLNSKLLALMLKYMEQASFSEDHLSQLIYRKQWLSSKGMLDWEQSTLTEFQDIQQKSTYQDLNYAFNNYRLEVELAKNDVYQHLITDQINLNRLNQGLDAFYLRAKLEVLCHMANHALLSRQAYVMDEIKGVLMVYDIRQQSIPKPYTIWYEALQMLLNPTQGSSYKALKSSFLSCFQHMSAIDNRVILHFLSNCARYSYVEAPEYNKEMFSLYTLQIDNGLLHVNGSIQPETFFNIISIAIVNQELAWAKQFFSDYVDSVNLLNEKSSDMILLCKAMLAFESKNYYSALELLNPTKFRDKQCKLSERRMRLKIYFELQMIDPLMDHINAFRKYLSVNSDSLPLHHLEGCRNFINFSVAMLDIQTKNEEEKKILEDKMKETRVLPERNWLLNLLEKAYISHENHKRK